MKQHHQRSVCWETALRQKVVRFWPFTKMKAVFVLSGIPQKVLIVSFIVSGFVFLSSCANRESIAEKNTRETRKIIRERRDFPTDWVLLEPAVHIYRHQLKPLDSLIRSEKEEYFNKCLDWVRISGIPEEECAYKLLDQVERYHGPTNNPEHYLQTADQLFFEKMDSVLIDFIKSRPNVAAKARKIFPGPDKLLEYYKRVYSFRKNAKELESGEILNYPGRDTSFLQNRTPH